MLKKLTNNLGLKLLSLLIAAIIWLVVVNVNDPVSTRTYSGVKVKVINENVVKNEGKVYEILDNSDEISVVVRAKRSVLDDLAASDFEAYADMKEMDITLGLIPIDVATIKHGNKIEEISSKTKNLKVAIEDFATKQFPITSQVVGEASEGHAVGDVAITPNVIKVSGPASAIEKISKVIVKVDVDGLSDNFNQRLTPIYLDQFGNELSLAGVSNNCPEVDVAVSMVKTREIPIKCTATGTPASGYNFVGMEISPATIKLKGNADALSKITEINLPANLINIQGATESVQKSVNITEYLPKGLELVNPEEKNVIVSALIEGVVKKTISVSTTKIKINNLTMGLAVAHTKDIISVDVSGGTEIMAVLSDSNITAEIDLGDYTIPGRYTVPVKIMAPSGVTIMNKVELEIVISQEVAS